SKLLRIQLEINKKPPLNSAVCLLSQVSLHNLAVDIFAIGVIVGVEILFHRYQRGSSHSFRVLDSDSRTSISPDPGHPACWECGDSSCASSAISKIRALFESTGRQLSPN